MSYKEEHKYDDIINLPHHMSKKHPQMSLLDRAAQFSPFAALTGHEDAIEETSRLTDERLELDENAINMLDIRLQLLRERLSEKPVIEFSYFKSDEKKMGGSYEKITGTVKKIDMYGQKIIMNEGCCIPIDNVVAIDGEIFKVIEEY